MMNNNMICCNTGSKTHIYRNQGTLSTPDITLANATLADRIEWQVVDELTSSDHSPIIITVQGDYDKLEETPRYTWNLKKARWNEFTKQIEDNIKEGNNGGGDNIDERRNNGDNNKPKCIEKMWKALRKIITKAANKWIGKKKCKPRNKPWLTSEIKERNRLKKNITSNQENRKKWIEKCQEISKLILENKQELWKQYVDKLDMKTKPTDV